MATSEICGAAGVNKGVWSSSIRRRAVLLLPMAGLLMLLLILFQGQLPVSIASSFHLFRRTVNSHLEQPGIPLSLQQRRDAFESARPLARTPPAPAQATWSTTHWTPALTPSKLAEAAQRLEELLSKPLNLTLPDQPWNQDMAGLQLHAIDKHKRHNPSYRAVTSANVSVFVKFPCIPGAPGFDASGACRAGMPPKFEATPDLHLKSIQAVSDMCGFGHLKSRTWSAPVQATTPEGIEVKGQLGFFAEWMPGANPEKWSKEQKRQWVNRIPIEWVWLAALHDFILCESDRHQANLVVQPDSTFRFIDNDHELNNRFGYGTQMLTAADGSCMPSSIFLPHSLESWRVWNYKLPLAKLDMRCWTGPDKDIPLPRPVRQCLQHFANSTPDNLQVELGLVRPEFAFSLKERAEDLLELGFWQALLRQTDRHARSFWEDPGRLPWADRMFPHWRRSLWRPLQAPLCDFPQPLPSDEID